MIEEKDDLPFEIVGLDTADKMVEMCEEKVIKEWNRDNPQLRAKNINEVGKKKLNGQGFGVGYNRVGKKIGEQIGRLRKAGYGVFTICHTKERTVTQRDGDEYQELGFSISDAVLKHIINPADFMVFITTEKEKDDQGNVIPKRYMYFRNDGYIKAGSRFDNLPTRIEYDIDELRDTVITLGKEIADTEENKKKAFGKMEEVMGVKNPKNVSEPELLEKCIEELSILKQELS